MRDGGRMRNGMGLSFRPRCAGGGRRKGSALLAGNGREGLGGIAGGGEVGHGREVSGTSMGIGAQTGGFDGVSSGRHPPGGHSDADWARMEERIRVEKERVRGAPATGARPSSAALRTGKVAGLTCVRVRSRRRLPDMGICGREGKDGWPGHAEEPQGEKRQMGAGDGVPWGRGRAVQVGRKAFLLRRAGLSSLPRVRGRRDRASSPACRHVRSSP